MMMRIKQGFRALFAWSQPVDFDLAAQYLSPALMALFRKMRRSEQLHSLNVLRMLQRQGYNHPALMVAALLHDVGKSRYPFHLWDRTLVVLVRAVFPKLFKRLGSQPSHWWNRPVTISVQHPAWSAEMVTAVGADPLAIELIRVHQQHLDHTPESEMERLLVALQAADDAN